MPDSAPSIASRGGSPWLPPSAFPSSAGDRAAVPCDGWPLAGGMSLVAGVLTPFTVSLGGAMPLGELVLFAAAAWSFLIAALSSAWPSPLWRNPVFLALLVCQAVALVAYVASDVYRGSDPGDYLRGWSRMVFLAIDLAAVAYLVGCSARNFLFLLVGVQLGEVLKAHVEGALFGDYWKFGYALPVTVVALLVAGRGGLLVCGAVATALGLLHFVLDFRSLGLICLLVAAFAFVHLFPRVWRVWLAPLGLVCGLGFGALVYSHTQSDHEGQRSTRSNVERSAMVSAGWEAFLQSPLLGHGSWFSRSNVIENFMVIREERAKLAGVGGFASANEEDEPVALHSQILVTLAEGGLFGAAFFIPYILLLVWAAWDQLVVRDWTPLATLRLFVLTLALFNAFLSPFSGAHRVNIALAATLIVLIHRERALLSDTAPAAPIA